MNFTLMSTNQNIGLKSIICLLVSFYITVNCQGQEVTVTDSLKTVSINNSYPNSTFDESIGLDILLSGVSSGYGIGINQVLGTDTNQSLIGINNIFTDSSATKQGLRNIINNENSLTRGIYNNLTTTGSGLQYGVYSTQNHSGSGKQYGIFQNLVNSGSGQVFGTSNRILGNGSNKNTGFSSEVISSNSSSNVLNRGLYISVDGSGGETRQGSYVNLNGSGDGNRLGNFIFIGGDGEGTNTAFSSNFLSSGSGIWYGTKISMTGTGTGTKYGTHNTITGNELENCYGNYSVIVGEGDGSHFGTYNRIVSSGDGYHYAGWFSAPGGSNDYAAVFDEGNVVANEVGGDYDFRIESIDNENIFLADGSANRIGIGTDSPERLFHIQKNDQNGAIALIENTNTDNSSDGLMIRLGPTTGTTSGNTFIVFRDGADNLMGDINGNGAGGVSYGTTSDRRLKQNIKPFKNGLSLVKKINAKEYEMKINPELKQVGFIAQELYEVFPQVVSGTPANPIETPMTVDYGKLTPVLVRAIQELADENERLKSQNVNQNQLIHNLAARLDNLEANQDSDKINTKEVVEN